MENTSKELKNFIIRITEKKKLIGCELKRWQKSIKRNIKTRGSQESKKEIKQREKERMWEDKILNGKINLLLKKG